MDIQKIATYGTAVAVVGTGSVVGGGALIDQQTGGPQKRAQAEDGIRDSSTSRGLGDVYKRQNVYCCLI